jgi:uncharacterized protein YjbI with pentapeptide repeats
LKQKVLSVLCLLALLFSMAVPACAQDLSSVMATVNSDKLVTISGKADGAGKTINILVKDPSGNVDYVNTCLSGTGGVFRVSYTMTNTAAGRYTVTVGAAGAANVASTSFLFGTNTLEAGAVLEGGRVKVTGILGAGAGRLVAVRITAPDDSDEYAGYTMSGAGGGFSLSYTLANTQEGKYTVRVGASGVDAPVLCYFLSGIPTEVKAKIDSQKLVTVEGTVNSPEKPVSVRINDPQGQTEYLGSVPADKDGKFSVSYTMTNTAKGLYTASISTKDLAAPVTAEFFYGNGLADLTMSPGSFSPVFASNELNYSATVGNSVDQVQVKPTATDPTAVISVNGSTVASGSMSAAIPVSVGRNVITIAVTERDASVTTYALVVTREEPPYVPPLYIPAIQRSTNANLSGLTLTGASLNGTFSAATLNYTANAPYGTSSMTVRPSVADSKSTVKVNGTAVTSGQASQAIPLGVGSTTVTVVVTAEAENTQTYTIVVTRTAASTNASLSSLTLLGASLNETFSPATLNYTASVPYTTASVAMRPSVADSKSTVTVSGAAVTSGQVSPSIALAEGSNTITVVVTAEAGNSQTYTITVTRASIANLSNLTLTGASLIEPFSPARLSYTANVLYTTTTVAVIPVVADSNSTVTVNGETVTSGQTSSPIPLAGGTNTVTVVVTGKAGNTQTYTITVTRALPPRGVLSELAIGAQAPISPALDSSHFDYTVSVPYGTTSTFVHAAAANPDDTVKIIFDHAYVGSGGHSGEINLNVGANAFTIEVFSSPTVLAKTYTLTVTREAKSTDTTLSEITLNAGAGDFAPALDADTGVYSATVDNGVSTITVGAIPSHPAALATVNGNLFSNTVSLAEGVNTITIVVTAEDRTKTQTYTLTVTRSSP